MTGPLELDPDQVTPTVTRRRRPFQPTAGTPAGTYPVTVSATGHLQRWSGAGCYRYRVHAYSGNGTYTLGYNTP